MKYVALILLFVIPFPSAAERKTVFNYDQLLERFDQDADGSITAEEFKGGARRFDWLDRNGDGTVTREEFDRSRNPSTRQPAHGNAVVHRDVEYAVADGQRLELDLYLPRTNHPPLVVWIHGGGWRNGDKANVNRAVLRLSGEGYAVASINYRLKDLSIHPKNIHDCKGAVRWLRANASRYGYDPDRIAVGGGSAGGHLALLLGLSTGERELEGTVGGHTNTPSSVKAVIDLYGPADLTEMRRQREHFNQAPPVDTAFLKHASPLTYLTPDDPPVLILHGSDDRTVPVEQSRLLHDRYQQMKLESELHILEGAGHGGAVFSNDEQYRRIKTFLDRYLKEAPPATGTSAPARPDGIQAF